MCVTIQNSCDILSYTFTGSTYQRRDDSSLDCGCCVNIGMPPLAINAWQGLRNIVRHNIRWRDSHFQATGSYIYVYVWTIDDPDHMRWLLRTGVDGIITNRPHTLSNVLRTMRMRDRVSRRRK